MPCRNFRRHRFTLAISLTLTLLVGCPAPTTPSATGKRPSGGNGSRQAANTGDMGGAAAAGPGGGSGSPGGGVAPGVNGASATPSVIAGQTAGKAAIDSQKFLLGRVFVPLGIVSNNGANVIGQNGANVIGQNGANVIGQNGANVIGQNGANVIGNNGANVIGQNGANIISNNGGGIISNNGGGIISNNGGSLGQRPLAYAALKVVDASGKPKLGRDGKPLEGVADAWGQFLIPRDEIDANCVIKVSSPLINGELTAFVARGAQTPESELAVDMVSTLSTTYILEKFVKGDQVVLGRLTSDIETEARYELVSAIGESGVSELKNLDSSILTEKVTQVVAKNADAADVFKRIEKQLILVGIVDEGDGLPALETALGQLSGLLYAEGGIFIHSFTRHVLWRLTEKGTLSVIVPGGGWGYPEAAPPLGEFEKHTGLAFHAGKLFCADTLNHRIVQVENGKVTVIAGNGMRGIAELPAKAADSPLSEPTGLSVLNDGRIVFSDSGNDRLLMIDVDGVLKKFAGGGDVLDAAGPANAAAISLKNPQGLALTEGGDLLICDYGNNRLRRWNLSDSTVVDLTATGALHMPVDVAVKGDGIYVLEHQRSNIRLVKNGVVSTVDKSKYRGPGIMLTDLSFPPALETTPDALILTMGGGQAVQVNLVTNELSVIAGQKDSQIKNMLNGANRFAIRSDGVIAVADFGGNRVYQVSPGGEMTTVIGDGMQGYVDESNRPIEVPLGPPTDVDWLPDGSLIVSVAGERPCIKRLLTTGRLETIAGNGRMSYDAAPVGPARAVSFANPRELLSLPDGSVLISEPGSYRVLRLQVDAVSLEDGWGTAPNLISLRAIDGGKIAYYDKGTRQVVEVSGLEKRVVAEAAAFEPLLDLTLIRAIAYGPDGRLYMADDKRVVRAAALGGEFEVVAGAGGLVLNGTSRDGGIREIRDIEISKAGDLYILELDQLKKVERAKLQPQ